MRNVLSDTASPCSSMAPKSHRLASPALHDGHLPHDGMNESTTWSPTSKSVTSSPSCSTTPAPSCPPRIGKPAIGMPPVTRWWSELHIPAASIRILISCAFGSPSSSSSICHGVLDFRSSAALVLIASSITLACVCASSAARR